MTGLSQLPQAFVFGESRDRTVLISFPADTLQELLVKGILRDFPGLKLPGTTYWQKGKIVSVQHRFPLVHLAHLQRITAGHIDLQWKRDKLYARDSIKLFE